MNIQLNPLNLQRVFHGIRFILRLVKIACREISNFFMYVYHYLSPIYTHRKSPTGFPLFLVRHKNHFPMQNLLSHTEVTICKYK